MINQLKFSTIKLIRSFRLSIYELALVSILSFFGNVFLLHKIGLSEFNRYALYLSYTIIINSLNLGLQLKIPNWLLNDGGKIKVLLAFVVQIVITIISLIFICLIRIFFPWLEFVPELGICIVAFLFVLSQQIDELFHTYCRIDDFEKHSFIYNLISKIGVLSIIVFMNLGSAYSYFKCISLFVFSISFFKLITFVKLNSFSSYLCENLRGKKSSIVEIVFESRSTWLSNISNSLFNGMGRVYLAAITPAGILGIYTLTSQVFVTIQALLSLHIIHLMKSISFKNAVRKLGKNRWKLNLVGIGLFSLGFAYAFYMLRVSNENSLNSLEISGLCFCIVSTVIMPIFSLQKFIILQLWGHLDQILFFNLKLALLSLFLLTLIFNFLDYKIFILLIMFFIGLISNININREFNKFK